jgi:hypothetical protein
LQFAASRREFNGLGANLGPLGLHSGCTLSGDFSSLSANHGVWRRTSSHIAFGTVDCGTAMPWWCHMVRIGEESNQVLQACASKDGDATQLLCSVSKGFPDGLDRFTHFSFDALGLAGPRSGEHGHPWYRSDPDNAHPDFC